jgi:hypothetical protein
MNYRIQLDLEAVLLAKFIGGSLPVNLSMRLRNSG